MQSFRCPYLKGDVELTEGRESHIAHSHPDLLPQYLGQLGQTVGDPDQVRRSVRMSGARLFYRRHEGVGGGRYIAVVVVSETTPKVRHWIITAYLTRRLANGEVEWERD